VHPDRILNQQELEAAVGRKARFDSQLFADLWMRAKAGTFEVNERQLLRHVLIIGASGSGKTNHAFQLIMEAMRRAPNASCVVIDTKREYRDLASICPQTQVFPIGAAPRYSFNPLVPPEGVDPDHWDRAFGDVFTRAYGLAEPSRRIVLDCLFRLRQSAKEPPTLRELEREVASFDAGSSKEQNSQRSLESRLHLINTGPLGESLNSELGLGFQNLERRVNVFEIGEVDSLRDQRFVAELLLAHLWHHDRASPWGEDEKLRRLLVVEEAHRYLSEERPPEQKGDRTLLELAIAEARRYGWGFLIIDQMPLLLSRYVWDNVGTALVHRLTNLDSYRAASRLFAEDPTGIGPWPDEKMAQIVLKLPEGLAIYRRYVDYGAGSGTASGITAVPKIK
jgi:DNA helicase HerA-like ATPase